METCGNLAFMFSILQIIIIDLVLSGDNAVVIGMATRNLDVRNRKKAVLLGALAAILLRIFFTYIAAVSLVQVPLLQLIGGLALIWIAVKLLVDNNVDCTIVSSQRSLLRAVKTIVLADLIMSLDNILAVGGASHGDLILLLFGLLFSMPLLMVGSQLLASLMSRFNWITYLGGVVIAWVAGEMIHSEIILKGLLVPNFSPFFISIFSVLVVLSTAKVIQSR
ncbi:MAG: Integral membrane protein TerC family protein [Pelotomaculum sp. PtaU1.Bin035]|nr:MAG: Integral membrane protein TerC family protein [Pelotomaculum sp. PtaU1.Bin035]